MDEGNDDEVMLLPGFRFHPTDEELVGFYLKRKIQQRPISIELIRQLDIYKFDPWDLPKMATTGEKEWYFYCPRDRKYRNSARPNRVTGAGFWKATGTDRPIYSSEGSKCIGLKKSLVFYKGRAAKGIKTDWMMHEFRLPSSGDLVPPKRLIDKNIPANDSWAICRIFKKTNASSQRALSHSWVSPLPQTSTQNTQTLFSPHQTNDFQPLYITSFSPPHDQLFNPIPQINPNIPVDASSVLLNMSSSVLGDLSTGISEREEYSDFQDPLNGFSIRLEETGLIADPNGDFGLPFGLMPLSVGDLGGKEHLIWDYSSPCPSEISTSYSTNKCYI